MYVRYVRKRGIRSDFKVFGYSILKNRVVFDWGGRIRGREDLVVGFGVCNLRVWVWICLVWGFISYLDGDVR